MRRTGIKITAWDCHNCETKSDQRSSTKLAEAFYKVRSQYQKASLRSLLTGGNGANVNFAVRDNSVSAKDGSMRGKGGQPDARPDLFMDKYDDLIAHRTNNFYGESAWPCSGAPTCSAPPALHGVSWPRARAWCRGRVFANAGA